MNGKILEKRIHVRVEHVVPSTCRDGHIARVKSNDAIKKAGGEKVLLKRTPVLPKPAAVVSYDEEPETIQPLPFSDLL